MKTPTSTDTIAAIATAPGKGGIGIIRISGPDTQQIAQAMLGSIPQPRIAEYHTFKDADNETIDEGIALLFPQPNSFTGEDVLELHGHGGPVVLDSLLAQILKQGARLAKPGEFSERAFLNGKLDLAQAEAIADLIDASSQQAARCAIRSLQGEFSREIQKLTQQVIELRCYVEAAIDFPEEEIDFLSDSHITTDLANIISQVNNVLTSAQQGVILREGIHLVIAGKPNAGKSSLLNRLCGRDSAIVTNIPGTTRDILRENIHIDGIPLHISDTAGLRDDPEIIEQEGIRRALEEIKQADHILYLIDCEKAELQENETIIHDLVANLSENAAITLIRNKIDLLAESPSKTIINNQTTLSLSAKTGAGIDLLREHLKTQIGYNTHCTSHFSARRRHLNALNKALRHLSHGQTQLQQHQAGELLAEDLRLCQLALNEITGEFHADDLLGQIFSQFCIGK